MNADERKVAQAKYDAFEEAATIVEEMVAEASSPALLEMLEGVKLKIAASLRKRGRRYLPDA